MVVEMSLLAGIIYFLSISRALGIYTITKEGRGKSEKERDL